MNQEPKKTRLPTTLAVVTVLVAAGFAVAAAPTPLSHSNNITGTLDADAAGSDHTLGYDPIIRDNNQEGLLPPGADPAGLDPARSLAASQLGWIEGHVVATISSDAVDETARTSDHPLASFEVRSGDGWFYSVDRAPGSSSFSWLPLQGGEYVGIQVAATPRTLDPNSPTDTTMCDDLAAHDLTTGDASGTTSATLTFTPHGDRDASSNAFRNDLMTVLVTGGIPDRADNIECDYSISFDFRLQFVFEVDRDTTPQQLSYPDVATFLVDTAAVVRDGVTQQAVLLAVIGAADDKTDPTYDEASATIQQFVEYLPVFPVAWACGLHGTVRTIACNEEIFGRHNTDGVVFFDAVIAEDGLGTYIFQTEEWLGFGVQGSWLIPPGGTADPSTGLKATLEPDPEIVVVSL